MPIPLLIPVIAGATAVGALVLRFSKVARDKAAAVAQEAKAKVLPPTVVATAPVAGVQQPTVQAAQAAASLVQPIQVQSIAPAAAPVPAPVDTNEDSGT